MKFRCALVVSLGVSLAAFQHFSSTAAAAPVIYPSIFTLSPDNNASRYYRPFIYINGSPGDVYSVASRNGIVTYDNFGSGSSGPEEWTLAEVLAETTGAAAFTISYTSAGSTIPSVYQLNIIASSVTPASFQHSTILSPAHNSTVYGSSLHVAWTRAANDPFSSVYVGVSLPSFPYTTLFYDNNLYSTDATYTNIPAGRGLVQATYGSQSSLLDTTTSLTLVSGPDIGLSTPAKLQYGSSTAAFFNVVVPEPTAVLTILPALVLLQRRR